MVIELENLENQVSISKICLKYFNQNKIIIEDTDNMAHLMATVNLLNTNSPNQVEM